MRATTSKIARFAIVLLGLAVVALALPGRASADLGGYEIAEYHTDLTVEQNADLVVEERIGVFFSAARHGIYRMIPVRYTDPKGYSYSTSFRLLGVTDDRGNDVGVNVANDGPYMRLRLGDPDRTVTGRQTYVIRYRVKNAVRAFEDHDEIYWNAVGDEWQTTISNATATVHLPGGVASDSIQALAFTGYAGRNEQDADVTVSGPGVVTYAATRALGPSEGMTVVAAWPKGVVNFPGPVARLLDLLLDNWILVAPLAALGFMVRRYRRQGRDPEVEAAVMVQYEPPEGLTPAEIGTLVDEQVDLRDITATIIDLAIRGQLVLGVEEKGGLFGKSRSTEFTRARPSGSGSLLDHEQRVLDGLFESGDHVTGAELREAFYTRLPAIRSALYARLAENGYFAGDPESARTRNVAIGVLAGVLTFVIGGAWAWLRGGVMPLALLVPGVSAVLVAAVVLVFTRAMPRRTEAGVRMRNWALGFQEYVNRVDADRIARDEQRGVFESLLPFAMALGVAAVWARKFEHIYDSAPPAWYVGPMPHGAFSTSGLEQSVTSAMADTAKAMAATPRPSGSSGIGGGGFSGGGFGGGGGGSW